MGDLKAIEARPYQEESVAAIFGEYERGVGSTLLVLPTGGGKTVVGGMVIERSLQEHGRRSLFLAHREELVNQAARTFRAFGHETAVEMGMNDARRDEALFGKADVVVGTVQTFQSSRLMSWDREAFGQIIIDEAHHAVAQSYANVLSWFRDRWLLGITATPGRGDGRNIGSVFETKCYQYSLRQAIREGYLVPIETQTLYVDVDLRGLKTTGGDFHDNDLARAIGPKIEELADAFKREFQGRKFVIFMPDVGTALAMAGVLSQMGVPTRHVAGEGGKFGMPKAERRETLAAFDRDEFLGLVCCELLIEGWDCPPVSCIGVGRATRQAGRYTQMVGRGTRPSPATGKVNCLVLDFDWETDEEGKDLCQAVELFDDGSFTEEVIVVAKEIASKGQCDPLKALEEAEVVVRARKTLMIQLTGKSAKYAKMVRDPVGVGKILDIPLTRRYDLDLKGTNPASEGQLGYLKSMGMQDAAGLSKWGASKLIEKLKKRREQGLASVGQVQALLSAGVQSDLARAMGSNEALSALMAIDATKPAKQGNLF